jgi:hypothetical protein
MYAYWADGDRQFLVWAFLNEGPTPLRLDKDAPVVGTCYIPKGWVSPIGAHEVLIPLFLVRNYLRKAEPPMRVGWQHGLCPGVFQLMFINYGPNLSANDVTKRGRGCALGGQGRQCYLPFLSPLVG